MMHDWLKRRSEWCPRIRNSLVDCTHLGRDRLRRSRTRLGVLASRFARRPLLAAATAIAASAAAPLAASAFTTFTLAWRGRVTLRDCGKARIGRGLILLRFGLTRRPLLLLTFTAAVAALTVPGLITIAALMLLRLRTFGRP